MTVPNKPKRSLLVPVLIIISALVIGTVVGIFWVIPSLKLAEATTQVLPNNAHVQAANFKNISL